MNTSIMYFPRFRVLFYIFNPLFGCLPCCLLRLTEQRNTFAGLHYAL